MTCKKMSFSENGQQAHRFVHTGQRPSVAGSLLFHQPMELLVFPDDQLQTDAYINRDVSENIKLLMPTTTLIDNSND